MIKIHCDLCDRVIPVKEVSGVHYELKIKKKEFNPYLGWNTEKIEVCSTCMQKICEEVLK